MNGITLKSDTVISRTAKAKSDPWITACVIALTGTGLVTLYSASYAFAARHFDGPWFFVKHQIVFALAGFVLFFIASKLKLESLRALIMPAVIITFALCVLTFIPGIGVEKNGASRWISFAGWTYQPSELVKLVLPLYLAHIFDKKKDKIDDLVKGILPQFIITSIFFSLIYLQNNFSTAFFIAMNALVIFFLSGVKLRYFFSGAIILLPLSFLLILTKEHRLRRFISFINPEWEPLGAGYQVKSSVLTIQSGGFWGKGIGGGTRKIASVPEIHSDFIFSAYSEEAGFLGVIIFILLFAVFAYRGYRCALQTVDVFRRLLVCGLVTTIISQAIANVAVISGMLPATGIPLPFFSAGGSSLATTLLICGLLVNASRVNRNENSNMEVENVK
jgi:cell division protein FtsW